MQRKIQGDTKYQTQDLAKYFTQQETMEHRILCLVIENGIMSFDRFFVDIKFQFEHTPLLYHFFLY
jgi:hypothetical protein